jgi:glycosyltransferase involved in cell wall biosynthesis
MEAIERRVLPEAAFLTAAGAAIAEAYRAKYAVEAISVNNVFPVPRRTPDFARPAAAPLRLFWFSQMIGPDRGLEDAVRAASLLDRPVWLGLLGSLHGSYPAQLQSLAAEVAPKLDLTFLGTCAPDEVLDAARTADVGLALEPGFSRNNDLALSNKICTYVLAGLAVAATDTKGQHAVAEDLGEGAVIYRPGDVPTLAAGLKHWADDPEALLRAKRASWEAGRRRWHWEHPLERGALLDAVARVFASR